MVLPADSSWIALFRGINVGGKNRLPMAELRSLLESLGFEDVASYIQSGNIVFAAKGNRGDLAARIAESVHEAFGFKPNLLLLASGEFIGIEKRNPFPDAIDDPRHLHVWFLEEEPASPDMERLASLATATERFNLRGEEFFLHAPDGIGRSKLAGRLENCLGVSGTARNWRTVSRLMEMIN